MKTFNKIAFIIMMAMFAVSCIDKTPDYDNFATKDVDFTYRVDDSPIGWTMTAMVWTSMWYRQWSLPTLLPSRAKCDGISATVQVPPK